MNLAQLAQRLPQAVVFVAGLTAAILGALGHLGGAVAALGVAVAVFPWLNRNLTRSVTGTRAAVRRVHRRLDVLEESSHKHEAAMKSQRKRLRAIAEHTETIRGLDVRPGVQETNRTLRELRRRIINVSYAVDATASEAVNLTRLQDRVIPGDETMPSLGGWAATNRTITEIVERVLAAPTHPRVVECGSGASTVWTAAALRHRGGGHVTALEHDGDYAEQTRHELARRGLSEYATVITAPITDLPGAPGRGWYDTSMVSDLGPIDMLFVDGPPGSTDGHARSPAWPHFAAEMVADGLVVLDDTDREDEQQIVEAWTTDTAAGKRLAVIANLGRATFMCVKIADEPT